MRVFRVLRGCGAPGPIIVLRGTRDDGRPFSQTLFCMGSMGARPTEDGISCIAYPTNTSVTPVEVVETGAAIRIGRVTRPDVWRAEDRAHARAYSSMARRSIPKGSPSPTQATASGSKRQV